MDRITSDLLAQNHITQTQIDRLLSRGVKEDTVLYTLTKVGAVSINFVKRFIVEQIRAGKYDLSILKNYTFLNEADVLKYLAQTLSLEFLDLDSIDMDYKLAERAPLSQLKKYNILPISQDDLHIQIAFADPLNIEAQEAAGRLFPRKIVTKVVATKKQIQEYLSKIALKDSIKELIINIRNELNTLNTIEDQQEASSILKLIEAHTY